MTSNQNEARRIIERALLGKNFLHGAGDAAQALADAGLLMPDLPEPDMTVTGQAPDGTIAPVSVWGYRAEVEAMRDAKTKRAAVTLFGEQVRDPRQIAHYLLAAADHMEKNA